MDGSSHKDIAARRTPHGAALAAGVAPRPASPALQARHAFQALLMLAALLSLAAPGARAACTDQDVAAIVSRTNAANAAIRAGSVEGYVQAMRAANAQVPADCRPVLDRLQPMATRCSAAEKRVAMDAFGSMMRAAPAHDWRRMVTAYDALERAVTPGCWIAINLRTEPDVVVNCRPAELERLASLAGPLIRATGRAADTGDASGVLQVLGGMPALTPRCQGAIQRNTPRPAAQAGGRPRPNAPGSVNDHGGGLYSVPGVGACGPSGCMAF